MSVLPELFSAAYNTFVAAIWMYALVIIYKFCVSLWTTIGLIKRMKWPNITLKLVQHPKFFQTFYNADAFLSLLHDVIQKDAASECETSFALFGSTVFLVTYSGDCVQALLTSPHCMNKAVRYLPIRETLGESLITAPAFKYRAARKIFMPIFHKRMTATFMQLLNKHILETTSQLDKHVNNGEFVVERYVERYVVKCNADFLVGIPTCDEEIEYYIQLTHNLSIILFTSMVRWLKLPSLIHKITPAGRAQTKFMRELKQFMCKAIERRRDILVEKNAEQEKKSESSIEKDNTTERILVDILLDPERKDGGDTFSELFAFAEASTSTTIHTINAALMMLAYHPEEQRKVYQELYDIYGLATPEDVPVVLSDHQFMHCMKRVIKETMRLFPAVPLIARSVEEDIRIGCVIVSTIYKGPRNGAYTFQSANVLGDQTIPKGCDACISIYGMHRSERYWTNPLKFDPDRFLPENSMDRSAWVYLPFSEGPRKCPGYAIAFETVTQFLATTLRKYIVSSDSITLVKDVKMKVEMAGSFVEPVKIKIEWRQPTSSMKSAAKED